MGHNLPVAVMPTRQRSLPPAPGQQYAIGEQLYATGHDPCTNAQTSAVAATLVYRIDVHARLLILRKKSPLYGLISVCTFIYFEKKFPPARLFHPACLLVLVCSKFHSTHDPEQSIPKHCQSNPKAIPKQSQSNPKVF